MNNVAPTIIESCAAALFAVAVLHTFSTKYFDHLGHVHPKHAGVFNLLGEVEVVFGFWALVLILFMVSHGGTKSAVSYLDGRNYTEPMFVFVVMVVAASRPLLNAAFALTYVIAKILPFNRSPALYFVALTFLPLLGSFITEPAAMTLAALLLRDRYYRRGLSHSLQYATLGVLFVNVSIGGTLTHFAAPPVLMVAGTWDWNLLFMLQNFGWKAASAVFLNAAIVTLVFRRELIALSENKAKTAGETERSPLALVVIHLFFLAGIVFFAHHPVVFMALFLFFLGVVNAYERFQSPLILREALLVAFFLAGLVTLGGLQQWWLQPLLQGMSANNVFIGAAALTAITDNAALTYLGSLVPGLSDEFKYSLVAGAVAGGGLTVIANAPNPAGYSILRGGFDEEAISPIHLLIAAIPPTFVALVAFRFL
ncbi:MAG TPA: putative Na+/H+ antiporter [Burkholderiales bacterium]|nr:putative Na+/H+ antiporter [Burkholderiales bacterium]